MNGPMRSRRVAVPFILFCLTFIIARSFYISTSSEDINRFVWPPQQPKDWIVRHTDQSDVVDLVYAGVGDELHDFYDTFKAASNVSSLKLHIYRTGHVSRDRTRWLNIKENDKLPPIKKLWTSGYAFDHRTYSHDLLKRFQKTNLDKWLEAMHWAELEWLILTEDDPYFYNRMKHELPGLHTLSISWHWRQAGNPQSSVDFISHVPALRSLSITIGAPWKTYGDEPMPTTRPDFPLDQIIQRHGPTIQRLSLHQRESGIPDLRRPMLSLDQISTIKSACSNLKHLGLDIDRNGSWPYETLDALMQIPTLRSVNLGLEIGADLHSSTREWDKDDYSPRGLNGPGPWREPRMSNKSVAVEMFSYLRSKKIGAELSSVRFIVGDIVGVIDSDREYRVPRWEKGRSRIWYCQAIEQGSDSVDNGGHDSITCEFLNGNEEEEEYGLDTQR